MNTAEVITKERDQYWDFTKGILITLVVIGHALQRTESWDIIAWIYTFHMPLFVFISGRFSNPSSRNYGRNLLRIFETYMIYLVFYRLIECRFHVSDLELYDFICPSFALWYLLSLIAWRLCIWKLPKLFVDNKNLLLACSIIVACVIGYVPLGSEFSFQRIFVFFPFFWGGYLSRDYNLKTQIESIPLTISIISLLGLYLLYALLNIDLEPVVRFMGYYDNYYTVKDIIPNTTVAMGLRLLCLLSGAISSALFLRLLLKVQNDRSFVIVGNTLFIYIYHILALTIISFAIGHGLPQNVIVIFLMSLLTVGVLDYVGRYKFTIYMLNPISTVFDIVKKKS